MESKQYDFVVVGAGSAGCVLANRLSEDGRYSVLLLEAGPVDNYPWIHVPIGYGKTMFHPTLNWGYTTEPDEGIAGRRMYWPRGKVLGGSSSINGLIYVRGQAEDFDDWAAMGNPGWGWDQVLPYFRRSEDQERGEDAYHGAGGPLAVSSVHENHPLVEAFISAGEQAGFPRSGDFNGASQEGVGYFQLTTKNGRRCSSAKAFLRPARQRANLTVETNAQTNGLVIEGNRVLGVRYRKDDADFTVNARREVVLSAGAINSPQIMELSGIGDPEILKEAGLPVVHPMKGVGRNLQDHLQARIISRCTQAITTNDDLASMVRKARIGLKYLLFRRGPLAVGINQAGGFVKTNDADSRPDIQFHFGTLSSDKPGAPVHEFPGFTLSSCQLRPESRGEVHVASNDPYEYPRIRPNYLSEEKDCEVMIAGFRLSRRVLEKPAMQPFVAEEHSPGRDVQSDDEILDYLRRDATTIFHPTGTCRMGPAEDDRSVVDARLRVHGLEGLRVADASIMPTIVSGNTNAACIMIGEKASDMILEDAVEAVCNQAASA